MNSKQKLIVITVLHYTPSNAHKITESSIELQCYKIQVAAVYGDLLIQVPYNTESRCVCRYNDTVLFRYY